MLLTYGEPPTANFFAQLRYSWRILLGLTRSVADIPAALLPLIALMRGFTRTSMWMREKFGSPLESLTEAQARGVAAALAEAAPEIDWRVHVAYEFRDPLLVDCVRRLPADEPVDVVPLYAADSAFTHQLSRDTLDGWQRRRGIRRPVRVLPPLPAATLAVLSADHVRRELAERGIVGGGDWALVLAAHGTLLDPPRPYETGRIATQELGEEIARRLDGQFGSASLGWLNHAYGGRWTEPPADQALRQVAEAGYRRVVYFPFGFLADNAESLLEGRQALATCPGLQAVHLPCLNDAPALMRALATQVVEAAREPGRPRGIETEFATPDVAASTPDGVAPGSNGSARGRRLDEVEPGERCVVLQLDGDPGNVRRLMELGLVPGTTVEVVRRAPFGDPLEVRVRDINLSVRRSETERIHVDGC